MVHTRSFEQEAQRELAQRFAGNYEHAQSLLRPVNETLRFFLLSPGGSRWIVDNGRNLRVQSSIIRVLILVSIRFGNR
jgi:hypothetical protein